MKRFIFLIVVLCFCTTESNSQTDNTHKSSLNPDYAGLQSAPSIDDNTLILNKIQELLELGQFFKYSQEIKNNFYFISKEENKFIVYILRKPISQNVLYLNNDNPRGSIKKTNIKDILEFEIERINNYPSIKLKDSEKLINSKDYIASLNNNNRGILDVNFIIRDKVLIDKQIANLSLMNSQMPNYGKILNKNLTTWKMRTIDNQPCQLFSDATAGIIIPHVNYSGSWGTEVRAKTLIIDKNWHRIVKFDKDLAANASPPYTLAYSYPSNTSTLGMPTDIAYGTKQPQSNGDTSYPIFVPDYSKNCIFKFKFVLKWIQMGGGTFLYNSDVEDNPEILKANVENPYALAFHPGTSASSNDDVLWYTYGNAGCKKLGVINAVTGNGYRGNEFTTLTYAGQTFKISVGRFSIYRSPDGQRNIMALIDNNSNMLFILKMTPQGFLDIDNPRFVVGAFNFTYQKLNSVLLTSNDNGIDGTTVWATADAGNWGCPGGHCGCISTLKVSYLDNVPVKAEYLASSWGGWGSDKSFADLKNLHTQNGFLDLFTMESWNDDYGLRRYKPGISIISENHSENYCHETGFSVYVKLSNPARCSFAAFYNPNTCAPNNWHTAPIVSINGVEYNPYSPPYLNSGNNVINIKVSGLPQTVLQNSRECEKLFRVDMILIPQDETDFTMNNVHKELRSYETGFGHCNSSGGCPFVYVNDGEDFKQDNNILHKSEFPENTGSDILDKYKLNVYPTDVNGNFELKIKELNDDYNYFDNFTLKAYDHPIGTELAITENKDVVIYFPSFVNSPSNADIDGDNVTDELGYDSAYTKTASGDENSELISSFKIPELRSGVISKVKSVYLTCLKTVMNNVNKLNKKNKSIRLRDNMLIDSTALILDPSSLDGYIHLINSKSDATSITAYDKELNYISDNKPIARRENKSIVILPVGQGLSIDSATADWNRDFEITFFAATDVFYGGFIENELELVDAENSVTGNMLSELSSINGRHAEMDNTSELTLKFRNNLPSLEEGFLRDYVLETTGRYEVATGNRPANVTAPDINMPKAYKLYQNYPNPFNPVTTIKYDIPKDGFVSIKIYDILGKEVYSLGENKRAGYYEWQFNGSNLSSGIYFYRIEATNFVNTKKMVLVK